MNELLTKDVALHTLLVIGIWVFSVVLSAWHLPVGVIAAIYLYEVGQVMGKHGESFTQALVLRKSWHKHAEWLGPAIAVLAFSLIWRVV